MGCIKCGKCCSMEDTESAIMLCYSDVTNIALELKLTVFDFLMKHTTTNGFYVFFKCSHLQNNLCTIYKVRPYQCASFPYWVDILEKNANGDFDWYINNCQLLQTFNEYITPEKIAEIKKEEHKRYHKGVLLEIMQAGLITEKQKKEYVTSRRYL